MKLIKRNDKAKVMNQLQQKRNDLWNEFWGFQDIFPSVEMNNFVPEVDIMENKKSFTIKANLPGVNPEDVDLEVDGNLLILSGKTETENEEEGSDYHRVERVSGSFYRSFELPPQADLNKITSTAKNGVLKIRIPKKSETKGKKIKIKVEK